MKKEIEVNDELIAKYMAGEATPEEAVALYDWLNTPGNQMYFNKMKNAWEKSFPSKTPPTIDLEKAWFNIDVGRKKHIESNKRVKQQNFPMVVLKVAASLLLILAFGLVLYFNNGVQNSKQLAASTTDSLQYIKLADNSSVVLNRNSRILYPGTFDGKFRQIQLLKGEAYFNVTPNKDKPFIIHTAIANIKVIGTSFNVILSHELLKVSVEKGKVMVYTDADSAFLEPGSNGSIQLGSSSFRVGASDANEWAYATHKFVFKNTPLKEVFSHIEKAHLCSILINNRAIGNCKLTATFESVSTDYMLTLITEALNLRVSKNDNTFTVEGEGCR